MVEVAAVAGLAAVGAALLYLAGARDAVLIPAASLPLGCAVFSTVLLLVVPLRAPVLGVLVALALAGIAGVVAAQVRWRAAGGFGTGWRAAAVLGAAVGVNALLAAVVRLVSPVNLTPDSFRYAASGSIIGQTSDLSEIGSRLLLTRQWTLPAVHSLASASGEVHLWSLSPLLAVSGLVLLAWFGRRLVRLDAVPAPVGAAVVSLAVALVLTNDRYLYHAFYLNGHMLFAVLALLVVGAAVLRMRADPALPPGVLQVLVTVPLAGLVPLRPEAALVALLLVAPLLVAREVPAVARIVPAVVLGAVTVWWSGLLWVSHVADGAPVPAAVRGLVVCGAALLVFAGVLRWLDRIRLARWLWPAGLGLWALLAVAAFRSPEVFADSVQATVSNQLSEGLWGASVMVLALLLIVLMVLLRWPAQSAFAFPLACFVPLAGLLALVREAGAYRVGPGDSFNRMLLHLLLVAALALVAAAGSRPRWSGPDTPVHDRARRDRVG